MAGDLEPLQNQGTARLIFTSLTSSDAGMAGLSTSPKWQGLTFCGRGKWS